MNSISLLIIITCLFALREKGFDSAARRFNKNKFHNFTWERESEEEEKKVKSAVCITSIYEISLHRLSAIA